MTRPMTKLPSFCLNRIRPLVRVRSPTIQSKTSQAEHKAGACKAGEDSADAKGEKSDAATKSGVSIGRKIMVVVDSSIEAKNALSWAITHTVQNQDTLVLLHVAKPSNYSQGEDPNKYVPRRVYSFLCSMKKMCQVKRPEVEIEMEVVEGKEKGPTIVEEAKRKGVALLVLGQKKRSTTWRLLMMWAGNTVAGGGGVVEYCIQNATCMAIAVRRKSKKLGGYLITTKRHKDFWLLA